MTGHVRTEQSLGMVLKRAEQCLLRAKSAAVKPAGLTLPQYVALAELDRCPGSTAATLARACLVTPQAMAVALASMHEQGLIERSPHPRHPNVLEVHLTDVGRCALNVAQERAEPIEQRILDGFSTAELAGLRALLVRFIEAVETPY